MPKDPSSRAMSSKSRGLYKPYACSQQGREDSQDSLSKDVEDAALQKEWDDATCPICMECPHNAVLLVCSSHDKGCRPYMCDTSYRHSNCLDQYKKASESDRSGGGTTAAVSDATVDSVAVQVPRERGDQRRARERVARRGAAGASVSGSRPDQPVEDRVSDRAGPVRHGIGPLDLDSERIRSVDEGDSHTDRSEDMEVSRESMDGRDVADTAVFGSAGESDLKCPLCRGKVKGWIVLESARQHLNHKKRSCAHESCPFSGTYDELRKHARGVHPLARPSDVDPARQRDWRRLERQRDLADVLSTFRSAMPGATVYGDYMIDDEEEEHEEDGEIEFPGDGENWWTMILLFQVFGPAANMGGGRTLNRLRGGGVARPSRIRQSSTVLSRQTLWGENLQGPGGGNANAGASGSGGPGETNLSSTSRRRRTRSRRGDPQ